MLYGCETWLEGDVQPVNKLYMMCLKHLLGVRSSTTNNLCMVELGYPTVKALIKARQRKFLKTMFNERRDMVDDPFNFTMNNILNENISSAKYVKSMIDKDDDDISISLRESKLKIINAHDSYRCMHYKEINPDLSFSSVYGPGHHVNELERISWTKLRLGAHSLAIETGRWNRRGQGRLPREQRLCTCGDIQTERHVIETCPLTNPLRHHYGFTTLAGLMVQNVNHAQVCNIVHQILNIYK